MPTLVPVGPDVSVWAADAAAPGRPNAGVVVDDDGITLVDALTTPAQASELARALEPTGRPIRRVVLTSSHAEYCGGTSTFALAAVYGTAQISAHLDLPPNPDGLSRLYPDLAAELGELTTRPVSHVIAEPAWISPTAVAVPVSGELAQNLVVQVPEAGVVFAGALCSFGVTPLCFEGDPQAWHAALDRVLDLGSVIVAGHGSVGGEAEVRTLQRYLEACVDAAGDPGRLGEGPWTDWAAPAYHAVNVERAALLARSEDRVPDTMLALLGLT